MATSTLVFIACARYGGEPTPNRTSVKGSKPYTYSDPQNEATQVPRDGDTLHNVHRRLRGLCLWNPWKHVPADTLRGADLFHFFLAAATHHPRPPALGGCCRHMVCAFLHTLRERRGNPSTHAPQAVEATFSAGGSSPTSDCRLHPSATPHPPSSGAAALKEALYPHGRTLEAGVAKQHALLPPPPYRS